METHTELKITLQETTLTTHNTIIYNFQLNMQVL